MPNDVVYMRSDELIASLCKAIGDESISTASDVLVWSVANRQAGMAELILKAGAHPDTQDQNGCTVLYVASQNLDLQTMRVLLDAHANPSAEGAMPCCLLPLIGAIQSQGRESDICEAVVLLACYGVDLEKTELPDGTPLKIAVHMELPQVVRTLRAYGAAVSPSTLWQPNLSGSVRAALTEPVTPLPKIRQVAVPVSFERDLQTGVFASILAYSQKKRTPSL
jgi:hypothetical protein